MRRLYERPYISTRRSRVFGDPLNDSEILACRVLCWSSVLMSIDVAVHRKGRAFDTSWFTNIVAVVSIVALVVAQRKLFWGGLVALAMAMRGKFDEYETQAERAQRGATRAHEQRERETCAAASASHFRSPNSVPPLPPPLPPLPYLTCAQVPGELVYEREHAKLRRQVFLDARRRAP